MTEPIPPLVEYEERVLQLDGQDAAFLSGLTWPIKLRKLRGDDYLLDPGPCVGVLTLPSGRRLEVRGKVPLRNLLYMLWKVSEDQWPFLEEAAEFERNENILEFLASHFADLVERRVESGLYRSYQEQEDNLPVLRGRIDFCEDVRRNHALRHRAFCRYAEFTWDVPENQIIRQVAHLLAGWGFRRNLQVRLRQIDTSLSDVSAITLSASALDRFHYHRLNQDYRQIHRLCRLFLQGASVSEQLGPFEFRTFLLNMNKLFEDFVSKVLGEPLSRTFEVHQQRSFYLDEDCKVRIQPDIVFGWGKKVALVAECKYKVAAEEYRNADIYQVLSYCTATGAKVAVLIYPLESTSIFGSVYVPDAQVYIYQVTLDLSRPNIEELEEGCDNLAKTVLKLAAKGVADS